MLAAAVALCAPVSAQRIGAEVAVPNHLADGDEFRTGLHDLLDHGELLFRANWTVQEGGGRPLTTGTGAPLADGSSPLVFPRNFNRISAPDSNSCFGCHNAPFGVAGGGGDFVTSVFVLGQRFDFSTFDHGDPIPKRGAVDESGAFVTQQSISNRRATLGMFGSGFIEMLARQMTAELQATRDTIPPGGAAPLRSKNVSFGTLARNADGTWDTSGVDGLPAPSLGSSGAGDPPSLIIRPFHQAGAVVSLRQFTNNAFNHHHGIQAVERFGASDVDGDGFVTEATTADITAVAVMQAVMSVPGRVIPRDRRIEQAVRLGEDRFASIGCVDCHVPALPLDHDGWIYSEPNPFNPDGNLQLDDPYVRRHGVLEVDLTRSDLPGPRLRVTRGRRGGDDDDERGGRGRRGGVVWVPAFTDFKLHDITSGPSDGNREPLDQQEPAGSASFFAGNGRFLTRKLWGVANEPPYFHHGQFTTMRQAVEAHAGEAQTVSDRYRALPAAEQDAIIEFLKTLRVLPPGTRHRIVDERNRPRRWRDFPAAR